MSQENVEVRNEAVRRFLATFDNDTDAFRNTLHPEIEWFPIEENLTPTYGVEGAMRLRNQWLDTWDEHRIDVEEVIEEGDSVVVLARDGSGQGQRGRGGPSLALSVQGAGRQGRLPL